MGRDLASDLSPAVTVPPVSITATKTGEIVDLKGFKGALWLLLFEAAITCTSSNKWTITIEHGDAADLSDAAAVTSVTGYVRNGSADKASLSTNMTGSNNDVVLTAVAPGSAGNSISLTLVDPSANDQALAITVTGTDISVSLATGPAGAITTTALELIAAIQANAAASALVTIALKGSDTGEAAVIALVKTNMAGGTDVTPTEAVNGAVALTGLTSTRGAFCELQYLGSKRYARAKITKAASAPNIVMSGVVLRGHPQYAPAGGGY